MPNYFSFFLNFLNHSNFLNLHLIARLSLVDFLYEIFYLFFADIIQMFKETLKAIMGSIGIAMSAIYQGMESSLSPYGVYAPIMLIIAIGVFGVIAYIIIATSKMVEDLE